MKKLTRKSLDELAKVMPVLNEQEQKESIGGTFYFSPDGKQLGEFGSGADIRIIDEAIFDRFKYGEGSGLYGQSKGFSSAGQNTQGEILSTMARDMGISSGVQ